MFSKISKFFGSIGTFFGTLFDKVQKKFYPHTVFHRTQMVNFNFLGTIYVMVSLICSVIITGKYDVLVLVGVLLLWLLYLGLFKFIRTRDRSDLSENSIVIMLMNLVLIHSLPMWFFFGSLWYVLFSFFVMIGTMKVFDGMDLSDSKVDTIDISWEYECIEDDTKVEPTPAQGPQDPPLQDVVK